MKRSSSARGFSLVEIVIVVAILALLAGMVAPVATSIVKQERNEATAARMQQVADAAYAYFQDTMVLPTTMTALTTNPNVAGWAGPYVVDGFAASAQGTAKFSEDAYGSTLVLTRLNSSSLRIRSYGPNMANGGGDDLDVLVNVIPIRRDVTLTRIAIWNAAINAYNQNRTSGQPALPANIRTAFSILVGAGYLPNDTKLQTDGFGSRFVANPPGKTPLVAVKSTKMSI